MTTQLEHDMNICKYNQDPSTCPKDPMNCQCLLDATMTPQLEQDLVYEAWRNSEAYQVPMTELGQTQAEQRYYGFQRGWEYAKFYEKHKHIDMKSFLENYF